MKKKIFNNIGLKILALLVAVLVWWIVMNIDDPLVKKTITGINVELRNDKALTDKGYIYEVDSGSVITIVVQAPDSVAKDLKASDFIAYADLGKLSPLTDTADIEIECVKSDVKGDIKEITSKVQVVKLSIDNKETAEIPVSINITGTPADNYIIGEKSISQNKIDVTGAASIIERIDHAEINYNVSNMMQSVNEMVAPTLYDADGNVISADSVQLSRSSLRLSVEILPKKWISVSVIPMVTAADGYIVTGYTQSFDKIEIAGSSDSLAELNTLAIPADAIVLENISKSQDKTINLANYLKGSYIIVSDTTELTVHIEVEPLIIKSYVVLKNGIEIYNCGEGLEAEIEDSRIEVKIEARKEVHDTFDMNVLNPNINLSGYEAGEYEVEVILSEDSNNYTIAEPVSVRVVITDEGDESQQEETTARKR